MRALRAAALIFSLYSRLPVPRVAWTDENRAVSLCFFPLVGAVIGGILGLWLLLCGKMKLDSLLQGAIGALIPLAVTGGIHMDGLMDTADALASLQPREKKLEILRDSRVGAFAVMTCCGYLLAQAALLGALEIRAILAAGACFVCSRAMSAWVLVSLPPARVDGMLADLARVSNGRAVRIADTAYLAACLVLWCRYSLPAAALCVLASALHTRVFARMALHQFGGLTGDLAGWFSQTMELLLLLSIVIGGGLA